MPTKDKGLLPDELEQETRRLASDLAFVARRPVHIQLVNGPHVAFTFGTEETNRPIQIVMNPDVLKDIRNRERSIMIWRGMGFHELAHHLFPSAKQHKQAHREGFGDLFNLMDDEQNERRGRAIDQKWGACFQSVCAHIFPSKNRDRDNLSNRLHGGHSDKPRKGFGATKIYARRWSDFAYHLRRQIPDARDPIVAEALSLIPKRYKGLTKDELLELVRRVHEVLCTGIELPKPPEDAPPPDEQEPEEAPDTDGPKDDEQDKKEDEDGENADDAGEDDKDKKREKPRGSWNIKKLVRSKWFWLAFGIFVLSWCAVLFQAGMSFWFQMAIMTLFAVGGLTAFLFLRRAWIKSMLAAIKRSTSPPAAGAASGAGPPNKWLVRILVLVVLTVLLVGSLFVYSIFGASLAVMMLSAGIMALCGLLTRLRHKQAAASRGASSGSKLESEPVGTAMAVDMLIGGLVMLGAMLHWLGALGFGLLVLAPVGGRHCGARSGRDSERFIVHDDRHYAGYRAGRSQGFG